MRVVVGSENPVKVAATDRVVADLFGADGSTTERGPTADPTVRSADVDSGVSEQPTGRAETVAGAENRAARALERDPAADYGVGVEGGVAESDARPGTVLIMRAAVADGERVARAGGPSIRLPEAIAERVRDGEELGPVLDDVLGTEGTKHAGGAAGALTAGAIDRESALAHAVAGAFGPFVADLY